MRQPPNQVRILEEINVTDPQGNSRKVYRLSQLVFPILGAEEGIETPVWYENGLRQPVTPLSENTFLEEPTGHILTKC